MPLVQSPGEECAAVAFECKYLNSDRERGIQSHPRKSLRSELLTTQLLEELDLPNGTPKCLLPHANHTAGSSATRSCVLLVHDAFLNFYCGIYT